MHLAAESHVDRSIDGPSVFVQTNVIGTCTMLEQSRLYYEGLDEAVRALFDSIMFLLTKCTAILIRRTICSRKLPHTRLRRLIRHPKLALTI